MTTNTQSFHTQIEQLINEQERITNSDQCKALATAIKTAIREYAGANENAFSVDAVYEDGEFRARVAFCEDSTMTIMYQTDSDNETVQSLFDGNNDDKIERIASLMLSEKWVTIA